MIKISANISKKVPIPGTDYSSQQFGAALEIELSDSDKPDAIRARIHDLYGLLAGAIDEQISGAIRGNGTAAVIQSTDRLTATSGSANTGYRNGRNGNRPAAGSSNGRKTTATEAQCRAIFAICKSMNLDMTTILADYNVADSSQLSVKAASQVIDDLKSRQNTNGSPR